VPSIWIPHTSSGMRARTVCSTHTASRMRSAATCLLDVEC
jgi:hypothetical protein